MAISDQLVRRQTVDPVEEAGCFIFSSPVLYFGEKEV